MPPFIVWLDDPQAQDESLVGPKAARLARLQQEGLPVPAAFVLSAEAFAEGLSEPVRDALLAAFDELRLVPGLVAVRSSAIAEDLVGASFAGVQESVLGVGERADLLAAVRRVWASAESEAALAYRERAGVARGAVAVLVQRQVSATVAGVAFARHPITGEEVLVVEAVPGLGEALVSGTAEPQRWVFPALGPESGTRPQEPLLDAGQLATLAALVAHASKLFGAPQDVEWAFEGAQPWLLQSRPITASPDPWFTTHLPDDPFLWTAAFLNERFTQPVSPLGWSLVEMPMERLALRASLELLGVGQMEGPLLKLWRGHPYSRVEAWQRLYKLFPDALLPDDAARFFPQGDLSLRHAPRWPTYGPHLIRNALRLLRTEFHAASPWHNPQAWARHEQRQAAAMIRLRFAERQLARHADPTAAARALLRESNALADELLTLHRWSLLYADVGYSLLRRALALRFGPQEGAARAARLAAGVETITGQMNRELGALVARLEPGTLTALLESDPPLPLPPAIQRFLETYGHRFFSLDLYDPPWEADVPAFLRFLQAVRAAGSMGEQEAPPQAQGRVALLLRPLVALACEYLRLREAQRFHWQQLLALQRRVALHLGAWWQQQGLLAEAEDVFGMTWDELLAGDPEPERPAARMERLRRLRAQARQAPGWHYPDFLRGRAPIRLSSGGAALQGRAVSPGVARGPARLIADPSELGRLQPGDILVTSSPDPGWTPIFGTVAGLVTERGGQLSHGAVVAREYALPAVFGIPGLLALLREGEPLLVDGTQGVVLREESREQSV